MRHYRPSTADLVDVVADFLKGIGPRLDGGDRYQALVCTHILAMVERELRGEPLADEDEAALAAAIRRGDRDGDWDAVFAHVLDRTIARVAIAKPDHLAPEHRPS
ncbi:aminoglycoside phosphotransferase [Sphingomonas sp. MM-1]|uniref:DUF6285 domain-containing protein n=1 Tax=Sphingomonas sp. MM-1 TaxID=745310 RepID=UPI0002C0FE1F|nr:DUF6285 domain-containing protein [Sphingomonas sp. MM-1]AGH48673.1 aminoglycoside phosphotransferase [Sphingomonas sp. MM-1]